MMHSLVGVRMAYKEGEYEEKRLQFNKQIVVFIPSSKDATSECKKIVQVKGVYVGMAPYILNLDPFPTYPLLIFCAHLYLIYTYNWHKWLANNDQ